MMMIHGYIILWPDHKAARLLDKENHLPANTMSVTICDLPDDVLRCIGERLVRVDRPVAATARDCAAAAMSCKALMTVAQSAWTALSGVAECLPSTTALAAEWKCINRPANKKHVVKLARNFEWYTPKLTYDLYNLLTANGGLLVGASCPIPALAARYILDLSWMAISVKNATAHFKDRDLSACERVSPQSLRYSSVLTAPKRVDDALSMRVKELRELDACLRARSGYKREWGNTNVGRVLRHEELLVWIRDNDLPTTLGARLVHELGHNGRLPPQKKQDALTYSNLLVQHGCGDEPIRSWGYFESDVMVAFCRGVQKKLLGEVVFSVHQLLRPSVHGHRQPCADDVDDILRYLALAAECRAAADRETLRACAGQHHHVLTYIERVSRVNVVAAAYWEARSGLRAP